MTTPDPCALSCRYAQDVGAPPGYSCAWRCMYADGEEPLGLCEFHPGGAGAGCDRDAVTNVGGEDLCRYHVEALYGRDPEEKD